MQVRRRVAAYGLCRDDHGRVLVVRASARSARPGTWFLPGGGVEHGEHPADAVVREVAEETGLVVQIVGVRDVVAEVVSRPDRIEHTDGVLYEVVAAGGHLRPEHHGSAEAPTWLRPAELAGKPMSQMLASALRLAAAPRVPIPESARAAPPRRGRRGQRFAAYGIATDPAGRVLLTLIADGYPGAGRWHLPGGGTDVGEQPAAGLLRELAEETGQTGQVRRLVTVTHHHNRAARGPEGYPIDWHAIRAIFEVEVPDPTPARVVEVGGSTAEARWLTRAQAHRLRLTDVARSALAGAG